MPTITSADDQNVALNVPLVTVLVPVAPAPERPGAGTAVQKKVPDTLVDVSVAIVSEPLPPRADADQLPVTVLPFVVITFNTVGVEAPMVVV